MMNRKAVLRMFTLAVGLITVAAIVLSQLFYFQDSVQHKAKKETKTEQKSDKNDKSDDEAYFTVPSTSMPSSSHVEMQQDTFFLLETILDAEEDVEPAEQRTKPLNLFFQTLFGALISPNAP